jgi:hypothetical protein
MYLHPNLLTEEKIKKKKKKKKKKDKAASAVATCVRTGLSAI